jgi:hypothetical protein
MSPLPTYREFEPRLLSFDEQPSPSGKTVVVTVTARFEDAPLGQIKWRNGSKRYAFFPASLRSYSADELHEIEMTIRSVKSGYLRRRRERDLAEARRILDMLRGGKP